MESVLKTFYKIIKENKYYKPEVEALYLSLVTMNSSADNVASSLRSGE